MKWQAEAHTIHLLAKKKRLNLQAKDGQTRYNNQQTSKRSKAIAPDTCRQKDTATYAEMHRLIYAPNRAQKSANVFARFRQRKEVCEASGTMPCFFVICSVIVEITYPFDKDNRYRRTRRQHRHVKRKRYGNPCRKACAKR